MQHIYKKIAILCAGIAAGVLLFGGTVAYAAPFSTFVGGTGNAGTLSGLLKGNGTSPFTVAANGTDFTLITALDCTGTGHLLKVTAAGVFTCSADTGGGSSTFGTSSISALYPVIYTQSSSLAQLSLGFSTTTQNFWNSFNSFTYGIFATLSSSTNATTTGSAYFTGVTASRPLYVDSTGKLGAAGSGTAGNCVNWQTNNTFGDTGSACGSGGSVSGTTGQVAYLSGVNTAVGTSTIFITPAGNVGISTSTPYSRLTIWGADTSAGTNAFMIVDSASTTLFKVTDTGSASTTGLVVSQLGSSGITCVQANSLGGISSTGAGCGTVTSVSGSGGSTGLTLTGGAITTSGTLTIGGTLAIGSGGTNTTGFNSNNVIYYDGTRQNTNTAFNVNISGNSVAFGLSTTSPFATLGVSYAYGRTNGVVFDFASSTASDSSTATDLLRLNSAGLLTLISASSTNLTVSSGLQIPNSSNPAPTTVGYLSQSTNAPYQLKAGTQGATTAVYDPRVAFTFGISTSTAWTGSTTAPSVVIPTGLTWNSVQCSTVPVGSTLNVQYQYANPAAYVTVLPTMFQASSTIGTENWTSSNTPITAATSTITFGTPAGSPTSVSCTLLGVVTGI